MPKVVLTNVNVNFPVYQSQGRSLKALVSSPLTKTRFTQGAKNRIYLDALCDISLSAKDGDRIGLIGSNGAGKSTLLRVLAGVYPPVTGAVEVEGRGSLLTTGLGMRDDASGYDNIKFCLLLQGVPTREIKELAREIAEFTELNEYLELNVSTYSAGMRLRLAFAISTAIKPDILVIDEIFGGGDAAFMKKAEQRMVDLIEKSKVLFLASHSFELIERFCNKAIWLDQGEIKCVGDVKPTHDAYLETVDR